MCLRWQKCLASFGLLYLMLIFPTMKIWQDDDGFCLPFPVLSCPLSLTRLTPLLPHAGFFFFLVPKRGWNGYGTLMIQYCQVSLTFLLGAYVHLIYGMPQLHGALRCTLNFHLRIGFPTKKKKEVKTTPFWSLHFGVTIILVEVNLVLVIFN